MSCLLHSQVQDCQPLTGVNEQKQWDQLNTIEQLLLTPGSRYLLLFEFSSLNYNNYNINIHTGMSVYIHVYIYKAPAHGRGECMCIANAIHFMNSWINQ